MKSVNKICKLIKKANATPSTEMNRRTLNDIFEAQDRSKTTTLYTPELRVLGGRVGYLVVTLMVICFVVAISIQSKRIEDLNHELEKARNNIALVPKEDTTTINFYLKEHQDTVAHHASLEPVTPQPQRVRVNQSDVLYYEIFEDEQEYVSPGIIVRGPTSQRQINSSESTAISNGRTLTLSEAQETTNFHLVAPPLLHPYYRLDQIRTIDGRDTMQMLYTNGINSISLFEQPLDGQHGLEPRDFREYAVYLNSDQDRGTILAWRDTTLSYVLIGNINLSQLMDMAQSINVRK